MLGVKKPQNPICDLVDGEMEDVSLWYYLSPVDGYDIPRLNYPIAQYFAADVTVLLYSPGRSRSFSR